MAVRPSPSSDAGHLEPQARDALAFGLSGSTSRRLGLLRAGLGHIGWGLAGLGLAGWGLAGLGLVGCGASTSPPTSTPYVWQLPAGFMPPPVPADNPMTEAKVALGRRLFYDVRLSGNQTQSCGTCHQQARAFTDGCAASLGSTGEAGRRSAPSLANVAYAPSQTWANGLVRSFEEQALLPLFGEEPVELGLSGLEDELIERLEADPEYPALFLDAFPERNGELSLATLVRALGAFQRTLVSGDAPYDRFRRGEDPAALSASAQRGLALFFSERLECSQCHGSFALTERTVTEADPPSLPVFHNTGLYNLDGQGAYPVSDQGLLEVTGEDVDMGAFRAPTLRNIALTAPYMHDGSIPTLDAVLDHYAAGGRTIASGAQAGAGSASPLKSPLLHGFTLSLEERSDLLAFLESLTDPMFLSDPRWADPFVNRRVQDAVAEDAASSDPVAPPQGECSP